MITIGVDPDTHTLFFAKGGFQIRSVRPRNARRYKLELSEMRRENGRLLPKSLRIKGPAFSMDVRFNRLRLSPAEEGPAPAPNDLSDGADGPSPEDEDTRTR